MKVNKKRPSQNSSQSNKIFYLVLYFFGISETLSTAFAYFSAFFTVLGLTWVCSAIFLAVDLGGQLLPTLFVSSFVSVYWFSPMSFFSSLYIFPIFSLVDSYLLSRINSPLTTSVWGSLWAKNRLEKDEQGNSSESIKERAGGNCYHSLDDKKTEEKIEGLRKPERIEFEIEMSQEESAEFLSTIIRLIIYKSYYNVVGWQPIKLIGYYQKRGIFAITRLRLTQCIPEKRIFWLLRGSYYTKILKKNWRPFGCVI